MRRRRASVKSAIRRETERVARVRRRLASPDPPPYPERPCERCGRMVQGWRDVKRIYCTDDCRLKAAAERRHAESASRPGLRRQCPVCGETIIVRTRRVYCTQACRRIAKRVRDRNAYAAEQGCA